MRGRGEQPMPVARESDLIVQELPDEVMVYDLTEHKAHCLNRTASLVWKRCDGKTTVGEAARALGEELGTPVDESVVWYALRQLRRYELLDGQFEVPSAFGVMTRREVVRKLCLAAGVGIPLITSLVAPMPVQAQSANPCVTTDCLPQGCPCVFDNECCTFNCNAFACGPEL